MGGRPVGDAHWRQQRSAPFTTFSPASPNALLTSMNTARVSARKERKNVDAVHFLKQHIPSS